MNESLIGSKIKAISELIVINQNRTLGYFTAAKKSIYADFDQLFFDLAFRSNNFIDELEIILKYLGGQPLGNNKSTGKVYRAWRDMKAANTLNNRKTILTCCESGEQEALKYYKELDENREILFTPDEQIIIDEQYHDIEMALDKIKALQKIEGTPL
jgi:uncharacterized protein (TIGR02284 family)